MQPQHHPRAAWPSGDDNTGFNLVVILVGACIGSYLLWTYHHAEISGAVMALRQMEIGFSAISPAGSSSPTGRWPRPTRAA